jgi:hypothetical protein
MDVLAALEASEIAQPIAVLRQVSALGSEVNADPARFAPLSRQYCCKGDPRGRVLLPEPHARREMLLER